MSETDHKLEQDALDAAFVSGFATIFAALLSSTIDSDLRTLPQARERFVKGLTTLRQACQIAKEEIAKGTP